MAAAYHRFYNGTVVAISKTGKTDPDIRKNNPHGPGPAGDSGPIQKTPGSTSVVTGK